MTGVRTSPIMMCEDELFQPLEAGKLVRPDRPGQWNRAVSMTRTNYSNLV
jgi:hypothetical protein